MKSIGVCWTRTSRRDASVASVRRPTSCARCEAEQLIVHVCVHRSISFAYMHFLSLQTLLPMLLSLDSQQNVEVEGKNEIFFSAVRFA